MYINIKNYNFTIISKLELVVITGIFTDTGVLDTFLVDRSI